MKKIMMRSIVCCLIVLFCWGFFLIHDRKNLNSNLIRFHVVANSDSKEDQTIKMNVRDAILASIQSDLRKISDFEEAKQYLQENLPKIQKLADQTLMHLGVQQTAQISLCKERFDIREYDTFTLPAGVYHSLRIVIGEGSGKNWWCVSFPTLCMPATTTEFADTAVSAGFSKPLVKSLSLDSDYDIHFFFLNQLGKLENIFFRE